MQIDSNTFRFDSDHSNEPLKFLLDTSTIIQSNFDCRNMLHAAAELCATTLADICCIMDTSDLRRLRYAKASKPAIDKKVTQATLNWLIDNIHFPHKKRKSKFPTEQAFCLDLSNQDLDSELTVSKIPSDLIDKGVQSLLWIPIPRDQQTNGAVLLAIAGNQQETKFTKMSVALASEFARRISDQIEIERLRNSVEPDIRFEKIETLLQ